MDSRFVAASVITSVLVVSAQAPEPVDAAMVEKIRAEGLERSQVWSMVDHLANTIGPRLTASPAFKRAADWARDRLTAFGLRDARLEPWEFGRGWTLDRFGVEMVEPRYMPLAGYPEAWSASTRGEIIGVPVFVGGRSIDDVKQMSARLKDAIVMTAPVETSFVRDDRPQPSLLPDPPAGPPAAVAPAARPTGPTARDWAELYHASGVGVLLKPNRGEHGTMFVLGRDGGAAAVPSVVMMAEHYNLVARLLARGEPVKLRVNVQARYLTDDTNGYNVIADIPGSDPTRATEVVMVGAHLDSWHSATGATDNADGAAVVLEVARILEAASARPRRPIRVALWGSEEEGLLGSRRWVDQHLQGDANREARDGFDVYFNVDPGYGPIYGFYLEGNAAVKPAFDAWLAPFRDLGARKNVLAGIGSTDHLSFMRAGVPAFNPIQEFADYDVRTHHTNVDTIERLREQDLKEAAVVLAAFVYHAAMREDRIPRAPAR